MYFNFGTQNGHFFFFFSFQYNIDYSVVAQGNYNIHLMLKMLFDIV